MQSIKLPKVILFGSEGGFTQHLLIKLLAKNVPISAIVLVTQTHKIKPFPIHIKQPYKPNGLEQMAVDAGIKLVKTSSLNNTDFVEKLVTVNAKIILVACFKHKIPDQIWQQTRFTCWNLHPSLLPKYRGPAPLYWQIKQSERKTGITIHKVTGQFDAGPIVSQKEISLPEQRDQSTLNNWVGQHGADLVYDALIYYGEGKIELVDQVESDMSYFP